MPGAGGPSTVGLSPWDRWLELTARIDGFPRHLSIHTGGYTTTWLANGYDPRRPLDPRLAQVVQSSIEHIYADFTGKAAQARKKTQPQIDAVGQGRVWTGAQALDKKLVDKYGGLIEAMLDAKKRAGMDADTPAELVILPQPPKGILQTVLGFLGGAAAAEQPVDLPAPLKQLLRGLPGSIIMQPDAIQARLPYQIVIE